MKGRSNPLYGGRGRGSPRRVVEDERTRHHGVRAMTLVDCAKLADARHAEVGERLARMEDGIEEVRRIMTAGALLNLRPGENGGGEDGTSLSYSGGDGAREPSTPAATTDVTGPTTPATRRASNRVIKTRGHWGCFGYTTPKQFLVALVLFAFVWFDRGHSYSGGDESNNNNKRSERKRIRFLGANGDTGPSSRPKSSLRVDARRGTLFADEDVEPSTPSFHPSFVPSPSGEQPPEGEGTSSPSNPSSAAIEAIHSDEPSQAESPSQGDEAPLEAGGEESAYEVHIVSSPMPDLNPRVFVCGGKGAQCCGSSALGQSDYRGSVSETFDGSQCVKWDSDDAKKKWGGDIVGEYPDAGLEDNNHCRNPGRSYVFPWCYVEANDGQNICFDVPYCIPQPAECDYMSPEAEVSEELDAACSLHSCLNMSNAEYESLADAVTEVPLLCRCQFSVLDCIIGTENCDSVYACCTSSEHDSFEEASCECAMRLACDEDGDADSCLAYAEDCCGDDIGCKCDYATKACHLGMEDEARTPKELYDICSETAGAYCCDSETTNDCRCSFDESLCYEYINHRADGCALFGESTCILEDTPCQWVHSNQCDFFSYLVDKLGYEDDVNGDRELGHRERACQTAEITYASRDEDLKGLQDMYNYTNGHHWLTKTGWMSEADRCQWYGVSCDEEGFVEEVRLAHNNLTGPFPSSIFRLLNLKTIDFRNNSLSGEFNQVPTLSGKYWFPTDNGRYEVLSYQKIAELRELAYVDLSQNNFNGTADILLAPSGQYVNFSHNNFTSVISQVYKPSHATLRVCDLSHNSIQHDIGHFLNDDTPPNLAELILTGNQIYGSLPTSMKLMPNMKKLFIDANRLGGRLPDFSTSYPLLEELVLSDQENLGITGPLLNVLSNLKFLEVLALGGNSLTGTVPYVFGSFEQLRQLNMSRNALGGSIPHELGYLGGLDILDLSDNLLTGRIPSGLGNLQYASISLVGNLGLNVTAPLGLCWDKNPESDLRHNKTLCPPERNALSEFYYSTKGGEWTDSMNWVDEFLPMCVWHGVKCDDSNTTVTRMDLRNNGVSGKISRSLGSLSSLTYLDLSDNDIKGSVPTEIGMLSNLTYLRLSYNSLTGEAPSQLENLHSLKKVQLQSNRIHGVLSLDFDPINEDSWFVSDCGSPSSFVDQLICDNCTICCNAQEDCVATEGTRIQEAGMSGVDNYQDFSWVVALSTVGFALALAGMSFLYGMRKRRRRRTTVVRRDKRLALNAFGDSVYQFFLSESPLGWAVALASLGVQLWILFIFVVAAEFDVSDDNSDVIYSWKCPRDQDQCENKADLDNRGWAALIIFMSLYLMKDFINGTKLLCLSGKETHSPSRRLRFFLGGLFLTFITIFTFYVSWIYNRAIATSNTEIIINSVIILFVSEVDELLYEILVAINHRWVKTISEQWRGDEGEEGSMTSSVEELWKEISALRNEIEVLKDKGSDVGDAWSAAEAQDAQSQSVTLVEPNK